jgi:hypothetical protein
MAVAQELYAQYAAIKTNIATLEKEKAIVGERLLEAMKKNDVMEEENDFGKFVVGMTKSWEYSDEFYKRDADLKDLRDKEQADGTAKFVTKPFLRFSAPKQ